VNLRKDHYLVEWLGFAKSVLAAMGGPVAAQYGHLLLGTSGPAWPRRVVGPKQWRQVSLNFAVSCGFAAVTR